MGSFINDNILKEKYFLISRIVIMLLIGIYGIIEMEKTTGVSAEILLLISLYISMICLKEFVEGKKELIFINGRWLHAISLHHSRNTGRM